MEGDNSNCDIEGGSSRDGDRDREIQEWRLTMYRSDMAFKSFKILVSLSEAVTQIRLKV